ncbi:hypothetical protein OUZ56_007670 [Daphnia magna]|uniref:Uncharacterized protein n=1 Tax=Daphnia magna TaxID=35525 RepID=A0ABR0AAN1_9CRUS|nr:hypothetical protein OUZ56_007670 [Daphnia magna]
MTRFLYCALPGAKNTHQTGQILRSDMGHNVVLDCEGDITFATIMFALVNELSHQSVASHSTESSPVIIAL